MIDNPYRPPGQDPREAHKPPLAAALVRGAYRGAAVLAVGTVVLIVTAIGLANFHDRGPSGGEFWIALLKMSLAIPLMAIVGALLGAALAVAARWLRRT